MIDHNSHANQYDVIIVGAGPAGLSAGRTLARLGFATLIVERQPEIGLKSPACNAILSPAPGLLRGRRLLGDLFYPELDLLIPSTLIVGYPRVQRFVSPGGDEVEAGLSTGDSSPVAAVDRAGLLRLMATQAEKSGAELWLGADVKGVIMEGDQVRGIRLADGEARAALVMSAEGAARRLSRSAGLFSPRTGHERHAYILTRELEAPAVQRHDAGVVTTFGHRYSSAREGFGTLVMPTSGRASISFTLLAEGPHHHTEASAEYYLDEYMEADPRVRDLVRDAQIVGRSSYRILLGDAPVRTARHGFLSMGDAATPGGHVGMLPAMYLGRKAALVAAEALDADDPSAQRLGLFGHLYNAQVLRTLRQEQRMMLGLAQMPDHDLDHLAQVIASLPLAAPFFGGWQGIAWEGSRWLNKRYPRSTYSQDLLQRVLDTDPVEQQILAPASLWPINRQTRAAL